MAGLSKKRIAWADELRGFCILCMVFYHGFYLIGTQTGIAFFTRLFAFFQPVQLLFASVFIFISGFCTQLSRNVAKRGAMLLCIALAISAVTILVLPRLGFAEFQDRFGILHLLSCCMLLYAAARKWVDRIPVRAGVILCCVLYVLTCMIPSGRFGLPFLNVPLPACLLQPYLFPIGLHDSSFRSADYFSLLPHGFVFLAGILIGRSVCAKPLSPSAYRVHVRLFAFFGRHSLIVYLLHVPLWLAFIRLFQHLQ